MTDPLEIRPSPPVIKWAIWFEV